MRNETNPYHYKNPLLLSTKYLIYGIHHFMIQHLGFLLLEDSLVNVEERFSELATLSSTLTDKNHARREQLQKDKIHSQQPQC